MSICFHLDRSVTYEFALVKYIFADSQKEKAIELKDKLNNFKDRFEILI